MICNPDKLEKAQPETFRLRLVFSLVPKPGFESEKLEIEIV